MKNFFSLICIGVLVTACNITSAENYFDRAALNSNKLVGFGSNDLIRFIELKETNNLFMVNGNQVEPTTKVEEYIKGYIIPDIETNIETIRTLKATEETKEMIVKSLEVFEYAKNTYSKEYIAIAKMIDNNESADAINLELIKLDSLKVPRFHVLHSELWALALPYAEANNIEVITH